MYGGATLGENGRDLNISLFTFLKQTLQKSDKVDAIEEITWKIQKKD